MSEISLALGKLADYINVGGPDLDEYDECLHTFSAIRLLRDGCVDEIRNFHNKFPEIYLNPNTMQGGAMLRRFGYPGDFEVIERIYEEYNSNEPLNRKWDDFFHWGAAARAVRGRRRFAAELFASTTKVSGSARILNIASGPCTDVRDALDLVGPHRLCFTCVDSDPYALAYASAKFSDGDGVEFVRDNALKMRPARAYDLVWSAGLFDYFDDRLFVILLKRLGRAVVRGGKLVVGNFGPENTQRSHMEFGFWDLFHRDRDHLLDLATTAGFSADRCSVSSEEAGVNLFLAIDF